MHRYWLLTACTLCTISVGANADVTILPVGDSITRGFSAQESYRVELVSRLSASGCVPVTRGSQPSLNNPWPHEGYSGHRADHFINGLAANPGIEDTLDTFSPPADPVDVVLLHIGTNDMIWQQSVSSTLNEIDDIINIIKLKSPTSRIFLANGVPLYVLFDTTGNNRLNAGTDEDFDGFFDVSNTDADALAAGIEANYVNDPNVVVVDVRTGFRPTDMDADGIHPTEDDASDPRSDSGEHHLAVAFAAALESDGICNPLASTDTSFPLTYILSPEVNMDDAISGAVRISGRAVDTGGSGFNRVRIAIQDNAFTSSNDRWWNFDSGEFDSFDSVDAHKIQSSTNYLEWRAGFSGDPGDSGTPINLPIGDFTVFALAIDNEGNQNYFNTALWPERTEFTVVGNGGGTCNGLEATVIVANGDVGTSGDDVILGTPGDDFIRARGGNDVICGEGGDDTIYGGFGKDQIFGGDGGDSIFGEAGNDFIDGNAGVDAIDGGSGNDIIFTGSGATVGTGAIVTGSDGDDILNGGPDADDLRGDGGTDIINGEDGNDVLRGGSGRDTISGGKGQDYLIGNTARDTLFGGEGDDVLNGGSGNDFLSGDAGNDEILGRTGDDIIDGGDGDDVIKGDAGVDAIDGGPGNDTIFTGSGATSGTSVFVTGSEGNDILNGGPDADDLRGDGGTDLINGADGNDVLRGGSGRDTIYGGKGRDLLLGNTARDRLFGGEGSDVLNGGSGNDFLSGDAGYDEILGSSGDDALNGGDGNDTLSGGTGTDTCDGQEGVDASDASCETSISVP